MTRLSAPAFGLVLAVALAASANSLRNGFVHDDVPIIVADPRIQEGAWRDLVTRPYWPPSYADSQLYRPVTSLSLGLDQQLSGGRPVLFHAVNVVLHLGVVTLVLTLASTLLAPAGAVVAALWFAVHPVHAEVVANVVGRAELLAALGYLGAVLAFQRGSAPETSPAGRWLLAAAVLVCGLLAVGSKEHALTLPAAVLLLAAAAAGRERAATALGRCWPLLAAGVAAPLLYLVAHHGVTHVGFGATQVAAGLEGKDAVERFVSMLPAYAAAARLLAFPLRLSADYSPLALDPSLSLSVPHVVGLLMLAGGAAAAWWARRRTPAVTLGLLWMVVTASVAANVVVPTGVLLAERNLYLPSVGTALALGGAWLLLPVHRAVWPATALVLALLGARTVERNTAWRDNDTFYDRLAGDAPRSYRSLWMRGSWEFRSGRYAAGERLYRAALRIHPRDASLVAEFGSWYLTARAYQPADRFLTMALQLDSLRSEAAVKAIFARSELGRHGSAAALARVALRRWPRRIDVLLVAVRSLQGAGDHPAAMRAAALLIARDDRWEHLQIAGDAYARGGCCETARTLVGRARARAPALDPAPSLLLEQIGAGGDCAERLR